VTPTAMGDSPNAKLPVLAGLLRSIVRKGYLTVIDWRGRKRGFGAPSSDLRATVRMRDRGLPWKIVAQPSLAFGEAYMDGRLTIESGTLRDLLEIVTSNMQALDQHPLQKLRRRLARLRPQAVRTRNHRRRARANVTHHYDLSGELYTLFLDADRQYSCAYFRTGKETLEEAQSAKKRHLAAKLLIRPGDEVLDIGCGWGGLALELAGTANARVTGITLSTEQLGVARERAKEAGLQDRVSFVLQDYRELDEQFDRIVSAGMFEHVGPAHFDPFFTAVARMLKPDGVAVIHSIARRAHTGGSDPWIRKYIFPGSYIPAISEVMAAVERTGLWATDIEILRLHYADTLRHWFERFQDSRQRATEIYDERFCRMWEFYLVACEMAFRHGNLMVVQIQLAHERNAVPPTRDYITDYERSSGRLDGRRDEGMSRFEPCPEDRSRKRA
jgi:cyclopropane-fatty-acyl-phospholipid synthase